MSALWKKGLLSAFKGNGGLTVIIYYCITIIANIAAVIVFSDRINITSISALPLSLIALMIFQALVFKHEKSEEDFRTAYGSNLTPNEERTLLCLNSISLLAAVPFMIPFIVFFSSPVKLISILVYIVGLIGGSVAYRIKNKGKTCSKE